jgi:hypothetical protein
MARKPNYGFDRQERERKKADKKAAKRDAKRDVKDSEENSSDTSVADLPEEASKLDNNSG